MPTLNFILRKGKNNTATIHINYNYGKYTKENLFRLRYSTGLKLQNFKNWHDDNQRIKNVNEEVDKININNKLSKTQSFLGELYSDLTINKNIIVTNEILTNELDIFFNKNVKPIKPD